MDVAGNYNPGDAAGFIRINSLRLVTPFNVCCGECRIRALSSVALPFVQMTPFFAKHIGSQFVRNYNDWIAVEYE